LALVGLNILQLIDPEVSKVADALEYEDHIAPRIPGNAICQEVIKSEQEVSDYTYSQDVPEELRMVHRFLRESYQLDLNVAPNYTRLKWMASNIFRYVGLERARVQMAESST
jgi:hypothetical protein